ncbi:MAG: glycosyltransferase [Saccharolobus sp.]|uniref:glycosyltransferase family 2 protein n=1 Tax=Saccharolobus sp. TaxID=2100761 RepID=UPI00316C7DE0
MCSLSQNHSISVCIITTSRRIHFFLHYCLKSLIQQISFPHQLIIIINGEINEEEIIALKEYIKTLATQGVRVKIIAIHPLAPVGFCRKLAVEFSDHEYIAFVDDDVILEKNWLNNIISSLTYEPDIVGGRVEILCQRFWEPLIKKYPFFTEYVSVKNYLLMRFHGKISNNIYLVSGIRGLWTNNLTIRRDFLRKIGNFRSLLGYLEDDVGGEDTELKHRVIRNNAKILYNHSAIVYHRVTPSRLSIRYCFRRAWAHGPFYAITIPLSSIIKGIIYNSLTTIWYLIIDRNKEGILSLTRTLTLLSALLHYRRTSRFLDRRIKRLKQVRYEVIDCV